MGYGHIDAVYETRAGLWGDIGGRTETRIADMGIKVGGATTGLEAIRIDEQVSRWDTTAD